MTLTWGYLISGQRVKWRETGSHQVADWAVAGVVGLEKIGSCASVPK
jgi:hypothetical protein